MARCGPAAHCLLRPHCRTPLARPGHHSSRLLSWHARKEAPHSLPFYDQAQLGEEMDKNYVYMREQAGAPTLKMQPNTRHATRS